MELGSGHMKGVEIVKKNKSVSANTLEGDWSPLAFSDKLLCHLFQFHPGVP